MKIPKLVLLRVFSSLSKMKTVLFLEIQVPFFQFSKRRKTVQSQNTLLTY